jgi:hypothetical protein
VKPLPITYCWGSKVFLQKAGCGGPGEYCRENWVGPTPLPGLAGIKESGESSVFYQVLSIKKEYFSITFLNIINQADKVLNKIQFFSLASGNHVE